MRSLVLPLLSSLLLACGGGGDAADAAPPDAMANSGTVSLSWAIRAGGETVGCEAVGALTVSFVGIEQNAVIGQTDSFGCAALGATTRAIPVGTYRVDIDLRAPGGSLIEAPIRMTDVVVNLNQDTNLGTIEFDVDPTGILRFDIDTAAAGTNCGAGPDDAGIEGMVLELRDADGSCIPATFTAGAVECMNDCLAGTPCDCIPEGTDVTATTPSGPHSLSISGLVDGAPCWQRLSTFTVPGNGLQVDLLTLQLNPDPECDEERRR